MRILHCADFHANESWFNWLVARSAGYSLLCLTGDCLDLLELHRIEDQVRLVRDAVQGAKCPVALCSGNNDSFTGPPDLGYLHHAAWMSATKRDTVWGDGDVFTLGGSRFRCVGWNSILPVADEREIWLSHAPPARSLTAMDQEAHDVGDEILGEACRAFKGPRVVLSGHQHSPRSWAELVGRTWCFNPGVTPNATVPNHVVVDLVANTATYRVNDLDRERLEIAPY
jgi:predicted phosphodiesterase